MPTSDPDYIVVDSRHNRAISGGAPFSKGNAIAMARELNAYVQRNAKQGEKRISPFYVRAL